MQDKTDLKTENQATFHAGCKLVTCRKKVINSELVDKKSLDPNIISAYNYIRLAMLTKNSNLRVQPKKFWKLTCLALTFWF